MGVDGFDAEPVVEHDAHAGGDRGAAVRKIHGGFALHIREATEEAVGLLRDSNRTWL